jgi:hypothetical protein
MLNRFIKEQKQGDFVTAILENSRDKGIRLSEAEMENNVSILL